MAKRVKHSFHGTVEQVQRDDLPVLTTTSLEAVEGMVLVLALFVIFFAFKNQFIVNSSRKFPARDDVEKKRPRGSATGMFGHRPGQTFKK